MPSLCGRFRRALRLIGWNVLLLAAGVALASVAGEAWFRLTKPFMESFRPLEFVSNVGRIRPPNTEIRATNRRDYWNVSRTNSLGFVDREPPSPERAKATCHVSVIGDSFVEALQVPIEDKVHVRLEELAADRLPHLDVTTSAFGMSNTGQVHQLPFYDQYARRLHPKLLVLVFVANDFSDNTLIRTSIVRKRQDGELEAAWLPHQDPPLSRDSLPPTSWPARLRNSWFALWLYDEIDGFILAGAEARRKRQTGRSSPFEGRLEEDTLQYTRFTLEQFRQRADRDGAKLAILAIHGVKFHRGFEQLGEMAAALGIPVIDQTDYILRQDADLMDAHWPHNGHWSPAGHQWAAEALLEHIEQHPDICDG